MFRLLQIQMDSYEIGVKNQLLEKTKYCLDSTEGQEVQRDETSSKTILMLNIENESLLMPHLSGWVA